MSQDNQPEFLDDPQGEALNAVLRQGAKHVSAWGALYFLHPDGVPDRQAVLDAVTPALADKPARLYQLRNGDFVITWKGMHRATLTQLCDALYPLLAPGEEPESRHRFYDMQAQGDALRMFWQGRLQQLTARQEVASREPPPPPPPPSASDLQHLDFLKAMETRRMRTSPHTLIVTDHHYSGKMLVSLIGVAHKTYLAEGSAQGLALFCRHAPDIVLLDLQETAEQAPGIIQSLRAIDPHIFIAMVAVNADMANTPGVNNFIVKPFTTAKLHAMIELLPRRR